MTFIGTFSIIYKVLSQRTFSQMIPMGMGERVCPGTKGAWLRRQRDGPSDLGTPWGSSKEGL